MAASSSPSPSSSPLPSLSPPRITRCGERPWDAWLAEVGRASPRIDPVEDVQQQTTARKTKRGVARLKRESMRLFGEYPGVDPLLAAVCCLCGLTVKCCSLRDHLVEEHRDPVVSAVLAPPPSPLPPPPAKIKSHSKSRHRSRESSAAKSTSRPSLPPPEPVLPPPPPVLDRVEPELPKPSVPAEVEVSVVEDEPPVVSIRDPTDGAVTPGGDGLADDIIEIMNSEGIQSVDDAVEIQWQGTARSTSTRSRAPQRVFESEAVAPPPIFVVPANPLPPPSIALMKPSSRPSKSKCPIREYDPDKHCGVIAGENVRPCTRSLTCKSHTLSLRRSVEGRSKLFDVLLAEHRAAKQAIVPRPPSRPRRISPERPTVSVPDLPPAPVVVVREPKIEPFLSPPPPLALPTIELPRFEIIETPEIKPRPEDIAVESVEDRLADPDPEDVYRYPCEPRPLAVCTFAARRMGDSFFLNRKLAPIRRDFKSLSRSRTGCVMDAYGSLASLGKSSQHGNAKANAPEVRRLVMSCPALEGTNENSVLFCNSVSGTRPNGRLPAAKRPSTDFDELKCSDAGRGKMSKRTDSMELSFLFDPMMNDEKC